MYHVKMAFALVQVGVNLWVNPMQVQGIRAAATLPNPGCETIILVEDTENGYWCSDWPFEKVKAALSAGAVAKALEGK